MRKILHLRRLCDCIGVLGGEFYFYFIFPTIKTIYFSAQPSPIDLFITQGLILHSGKNFCAQFI
jgi:hypothetical protein